MTTEGTPTVCPPRRIDPVALRELREARGLSRERLAVAAGVSSRTVARAELGEANPVGAVVTVLAAVLGVEIEALTCDDPAPTGEAAAKIDVGAVDEFPP